MNTADIKNLLGIEEDGIYRVNPDTGLVEKEQGIGWIPTNVRVDPESGDICELGLLGNRGTPTGVRIDPNSGRIQVEEGLMHRDTGLRVDPDTGRIQEEQLIGWKETGERVNPKSGVLETEQGIGWRPGVTAPSRAENYLGARVETSSGGEGIIATLANFAGMIGAGIGAIGGLVWAFDSSYGFLGYILSFVIGALIGAAVGSIGVYLLFIGAGLFILVSILRACGVSI